MKWAAAAVAGTSPLLPSPPLSVWLQIARNSAMASLWESESPTWLAPAANSTAESLRSPLESISSKRCHRLLKYTSACSSRSNSWMSTKPSPLKSAARWAASTGGDAPPWPAVWSYSGHAVTIALSSSATDSSPFPLASMSWKSARLEAASGQRSGAASFALIFATSPSIELSSARSVARSSAEASADSVFSRACSSLRRASSWTSLASCPKQ
jgi:hypothetical protein